LHSLAAAVVPVDADACSFAEHDRVTAESAESCAAWEKVGEELAGV
jgi:uncharacterized protein (DUF736 family)